MKTNEPIFESLENRTLFSGTGLFSSVTSRVPGPISAAVERLKSVIAQQGEQEQDQTTRAPGSISETIASLKYHAELFGADKAALAGAIREAGKENADSYDNALRLLIANGMGLPAEALASNLKAKELLQHVADLNLVGADDKPADKTYWRGVIANGAEQSLANVVANQLGVPEAAAQGKLARELLQGAADIALVGGDARSLVAWNGLAQVKAGKISVEDFAQNFTHGNDIKSSDQNSATQAQDFKQAKDQVGSIVREAIGSGIGQQPQQNAQPAPAENVQPAPSNPDAGAGDAAEQVITATFSNIDNNPDGSGTYTVTINYPDGTHETRQVTVNADGSSTIVRGDGTTESHPPGSTAMPPDSAEGQTAVVNQDTDGDGNNDSATTSDEDDDDDNDDDDENSSDDSSSSNDATDSNDSSNSGSGGDESKGTPNPETLVGNIANGAEFYFNTPIGRSLAGSLIDPVKSQRGGGAIDPVEGSVNYAGAAEFYARFGGDAQLKTTGGDIDYPDGHGPNYVIIDQRQLEAIRIASGGDVGGPDIGRKPAPPPAESGGILPAPAPVAPGGTQAVFSQVQIAAKVSLAASVSLNAVSIRR